jgi:hypothetical protein
MHMTREQIQSLDSSQLRAIVKSTSPSGRYRFELFWAQQELARRRRIAAQNIASDAPKAR